MSHDDNNEIIIYGISGSPGICIGKAYLVDKGGVEVVPQYTFVKSKLTAEKKRFKAAVKRAMDELRKIIKETPEELREQTHILESHTVLLKDKMFYGRTIDTIDREQINAEWALKKVVSIIRPMFENMDDPYLRDRGEDILHESGEKQGQVDRRRRWHPACVDLYNASDPREARRRIRKRDRGRCAACGVDTYALRREFRAIGRGRNRAMRERGLDHWLGAET